MRSRIFRQRPLLTLPQILALLAVIAALYIALDLNRRAQAGRLVGIGQEALQSQIGVEQTRQVELQVTLAYVTSDDYAVDYARDEGALQLPGEKRVVPLPIEVKADALAAPVSTPDPALNARPWQAWWRLLSDAPLPTSP